MVVFAATRLPIPELLFASFQFVEENISAIQALWQESCWLS